MVKSFLLRRKFPSSIFYKGVSVDNNSQVSQDCVFFENVSILDSVIGDRSYIQKNSCVSFANVGKFCSIASNVSIGLAEHPTNMVSTSPVFYDNSQPLPFFFASRKLFHDTHPRTSIGSDVWIGQGALVKAGVTVGVGAVIAAGAVVVKDVEPYSIVGGCPSKHIKWRFDSSVREGLIKSQWWQYEDEKLSEIINLFGNPIDFIAALNQE